MGQERSRFYDLYSPLSYKNVLSEYIVIIGIMVVCAIMFSILFDNVYFVFFKTHLPTHTIVMVGGLFWLFLVLTAYGVVDHYQKRVGQTNSLLSEILNVGFNLRVARKLSDSIASTLSLDVADEVSVLPYRDLDIAILNPYAGKFRQLVVITKTDDYLLMYNSNYQVVRFKKIKEDYDVV